ncbi:hypothetical protein ACH5RR_003734 [Cinchona calisaya]|uniref:Uncharacterized protein n=1 Tax=Cinchona calisaya TaxID=153742 RepID=A0ABD3AVV9_9GENT
MQLWDEIRKLKSIITNDAWLLTGDFNVIRFDNERLGSQDRDKKPIQEFEDCVHQIDVDDVPSKGLVSIKEKFNPGAKPFKYHI